MNLYVFSIGGSGVRVLHSLTMLLAAGVKMKSTEVIPVIIDTDEKNGNTLTTLAGIEHYCNIYDRVSKMNGNKTKLNNKEVDRTSLFATKIAKPRIVTISGTALGDLKTVVGENAVGIDPELKTLLRTLYEEDELDMLLTHGFIGHPNIGCVVLNYLFKTDETFKNTAKEIQKDDKIFLISSIFGGTGAAGFPLMLNILNHSKDEDAPLNKKNNIKGALSIVPYYTVGDTSNDVDNSALNATDAGGNKKYSVNSGLFDSKTFAAQLYYDSYIDDIDVMYYVGDKKYKSRYDNYLGGKNQNNPAHVVEMFGALSIAHFDNEKNKDNKFEYANLIFDTDDSDLTAGSNEELCESLIRLWMFRRFFINYLPENYLSNNQQFLQDIGYNGNNYEENKPESFSLNMKNFLAIFEKWTKDLNNEQKHTRKFKFVDINANPEDEFVHCGFEDRKPNEGGFLKKTIIQSNLLGFLNEVAKKNLNVDVADVHSRITRYAAQVIDEIINSNMK